VPTVVARLPETERDAFKDPLGKVFESAESLLQNAETPIIAVGDVVLAHLGKAGCAPAVSVIDGRTQRGELDEWVREARPKSADERRVENPAGTITAELVEAIETGLESDEPTRIVVNGEEDLAVLPAILLAPPGATIVYGQPGEGMVAVPVEGAVKATARGLLERLERDPEFWEPVA